MTVDDIFRAARQQLKQSYPLQEINAMLRVLLQHYTGLTTAQIYADPQQLLPTANCQLLTEALKQLSAGRPLQYVIGETDFCGLTFEVDEQVLIPRPETEELVHWAVEELQAYTAPVVLDLCTGSGCIAVAVAKQCPAAKVLACDISSGALEVAQRNAARNDVTVDFFQCDILNQVSGIRYQVSGINSSFIILSNPPYVRNSEKAMMRQNVLEHEPHGALFVADDDPLIYYRAIAAIARQCIVADGFVMVEINEALAADTMQIFRAAGFSSLSLRQDLNSKNRMIMIND